MGDFDFSLDCSLFAQYQRTGFIAHCDDITADLSIHAQASAEMDASFDARSSTDKRIDMVLRITGFFAEH
jgi:hypothetical protein